MPTNLKSWEHRVVEMQKCKRVAELVARHGEAHHKVQQAGFEIWHYPLGVASRTLYSVHVSVYPDQSCQAFMFMEPSELADSPVQSPTFSESVRQGASEAFRWLGSILGRKRA
jgi:hypothetical protein